MEKLIPDIIGKYVKFELKDDELKKMISDIESCPHFYSNIRIFIQFGKKCQYIDKEQKSLCKQFKSK
jgi:hypothetical protein